MTKKTVLMPIEVPEGCYCWRSTADEGTVRLCKHFDNEGGHAHCALSFYPLKPVSDGVKKSPDCMNLVDSERQDKKTDAALRASSQVLSSFKTLLRKVAKSNGRCITDKHMDSMLKAIEKTHRHLAEVAMKEPNTKSHKPGSELNIYDLLEGDRYELKRTGEHYSFKCVDPERRTHALVVDRYKKVRSVSRQSRVILL